MNRIHIVGHKNSGKTTLVVELVEWFSQRGVTVGTIKHTHHHHELDTPGKDSFQHREAGADAVGILSPAMNAIFWPASSKKHPHQQNQNDKLPKEKRYTQFQSLMEQCDVVLVEGDSSTEAIKLEVWREEINSQPMLVEENSITGLISNDEFHTKHIRFRRSDIHEIAVWILEKSGINLEF